MMGQLRELGARLRNVFAVGEFQKRYADGDKKDQIQVKTHNGRVVEKKEAFPYGFCAKAKSGRVFVFCQGGNLDGFEIFPTQPGDNITPPELEEGDVAIYTGNGGYTVYREAGDVEVYAKEEGKATINTEGGDVEINVSGGGKVKIICKDGKFYFGNNGKNICELFIGLIDEIKAIITSGGPPSHTINPATQQKLEAYKNQVKTLFMESA
jgi:phage gp45-like